MRLVVLVPLAVGCVRVEVPLAPQTLSADGVSSVRGALANGVFSYEGSSIARNFYVTGTSWGFGSSHDKATEHGADNTASVALDGAALMVATGAGPHAGVDVDVGGPEVMDLDLASDGSLRINDVIGTHVLSADAISANALQGDVDATATLDGMSVEIWPYEGGLVTLWARSGNLTLYLPYAGDYHLVVIGDPNEAMTIADLGFSSSFLGTGSFESFTGAASIEVDVEVDNGSFDLEESTGF